MGEHQTWSIVLAGRRISDTQKSLEDAADSAEPRREVRTAGPTDREDLS